MRPCNRKVALRLAEAGLAVFPAGPDKKPLLSWRKLSTSDPTVIERLWERWPDAMPALDLAKSNYVVLDGTVTMVLMASRRCEGYSSSNANSTARHPWS